MSCLVQHFILASSNTTNPPLQATVAELVIALIILLLVATGVALISRRFRVPYVTGLVLTGLALPSKAIVPTCSRA